MNFRDLLAVLAMIGPAVLLVAAVAFGRVLSPDAPSAPPQTQAQKAAQPPYPATQKQMRNPWEKPPYAKTAKVSAK